MKSTSSALYCCVVQGEPNVSEGHVMSGFRIKKLDILFEPEDEVSMFF
jgi:hypothetical protein